MQYYLNLNFQVRPGQGPESKESKKLRDSNCTTLMLIVVITVSEAQLGNIFRIKMCWHAKLMCMSLQWHMVVVDISWKRRSSAFPSEEKPLSSLLLVALALRA